MKPWLAVISILCIPLVGCAQFSSGKIIVPQPGRQLYDLRATPGASSINDLENQQNLQETRTLEPYENAPADSLDIPSLKPFTPADQIILISPDESIWVVERFNAREVPIHPPGEQIASDQDFGTVSNVVAASVFIACAILYPGVTLGGMAELIAAIPYVPASSSAAAAAIPFIAAVGAGFGTEAVSKQFNSQEQDSEKPQPEENDTQEKESEKQGVQSSAGNGGHDEDTTSQEADFDKDIFFSCTWDCLEGNLKETMSQARSNAYLAEVLQSELRTLANIHLPIATEAPFESAVLEPTITQAQLEFGAGANQRIGHLKLTATLARKNVTTGELQQERVEAFTVEKQICNNWCAEGVEQMRMAVDTAIQTLARQMVLRLAAKDAVGCLDYTGLRAVYPPMSLDRVGQVAVPSVATLQPTLKWSSSESPTTAEEVYDLRIWDISSMSNKENIADMNPVYERSDLPMPYHTVEESLHPAHTYAWTVRLRQHGNGPFTVYPWSIASNRCAANQRRQVIIYQFLTPGL